MDLTLTMIDMHHDWFVSPPQDPILEWIANTLRSYYTQHPCPLVCQRDLETFFWIQLQDGRLPFFPYSHLLVDEFQDTSKVEFDICLHYLNHTPLSLFVVGDAKQSIYGFRKANIGNFSSIQEIIQKRHGTVVHLRQNFRSHPKIVSLCNDYQTRLLANIPDPLLIPMQQLDTNDNSPTVLFRHLNREDLWSSISLRCQVATQDDTSIAFLFRTNQEMRRALAALPQETQANVQVLSRKNDPVFRLPFVHGILLGYLHALWPEKPLYAFGWHNCAWTPTDIVPRFSLDTHSTFQTLVRCGTTPPTAVTDITKVYSIMVRVDEAAKVFLPDYPYQMEDWVLSLLDPIRSESMEAEDTQSEDPVLQNPVVFSTLHGTKGLEFDTVVIPLTKSTILPVRRFPSILEDQSRWGYRFRPSESAITWTEIQDYATLKDRHRKLHQNEELRLLYVALSRAKKHVEVLALPNEIPKSIQPWLQGQDELFGTCR